MFLYRSVSGNHELLHICLLILKLSGMSLKINKMIKCVMGQSTGNDSEDRNISSKHTIDNKRLSDTNKSMSRK